MSLAPPHFLRLSTNSVVHQANCPPSPPPPVFSVTSAFFESPFSVSNQNIQPHQSPHCDSMHLFNDPLSPPSPAICGNPPASGFKFEKLTPKHGGVADDAVGNENRHHHHPQQQQSHYDSSWKFPSSSSWTTPRAEWTPLSSRFSTPNHHHRASFSSFPRELTPGHHHGSEDRLDRLLAEMESPISSPVKPASLPSSFVSSTPASQSDGHQAECWERACLETRFHPIHASSPCDPLRPCLKKNKRSRSPSLSSSASSASQPLEEPSEPSQVPAHLDDLHSDSGRAIRVRFDDDQIEEILTWSRESYDRKGPQPITKLNVREIIELKLIKEELGISSSSKKAP